MRLSRKMVRAIASCVLAPLACAVFAVFAGPAVAAPANDRWTSAAIVPAPGIAASVDSAGATADPAEPAPSCAGAQLPNAIWYRIQVPRRARRIARFAARGRGAATVVAVFAVEPQLGTELACVQAQAGAIAAFEHVLASGLTYYVGVGSAAGGAAGDTIDVQVALRPTNWLGALPLPARRQGVQLAATGASVWSFGGLQTSFVPGARSGFHSEAVNRLDARTGRWQAVAQLPAGLSYGGAAVLGRNVHLPGGQANPVNGAGCAVGTHHVFDTRTRTFAQAAPVPGPPTWDYAAAADNARGLVYLAGGVWDPTPCDFGSTVNDQQATPRIRAWHAGRGQWFELTPLGAARQGATAQVVDGRLYVLGGLRGTTALATVESYDPVSGRVAARAQMPVPVYGAASGVGQGRDGRPLVYVAGGWSHAAGGADVGVTQVYDVRANRWSVAASATMTPRDALRGAVAQGYLYTVGGHGPQPVRAVERLKVDAAAPRLKVRRRGGWWRAAASDPAGVASIEWRAGRRLVGRGRKLRVRAGLRNLRVTVRDRAGNRVTRRVR